MPILRAELEGLVAAGADRIQIDEPSPAIHPDAPADFSALFNAAVAPIVGRARLGAHLCFGNYLGAAARAADLPAGPRRDARLPRRRTRPRVRQPRDGRGRDPGRDRRRPAATSRPASSTSRTRTSRRRTTSPSGSTPCWPPASRPSGLTLVPDCGFSQTPRAATRAKLRALVAGRDLVLGRNGREDR